MTGPARALLLVLAVGIVPTRPAVAGVRTIYVSPGGRSMVTTADPIATASLLDKSTAARFAFTQYTHDLAVVGQRLGEATIVVHGTTQGAEERVHVFVIDAKADARRRLLVDRFAPDGGLEILASTRTVVISGTAFSGSDLRGCVDEEKEESVICAAGLDGVAAVIDPQLTMTPRASLEMTAASQPDLWILKVRIGDLPVLELRSASYGSLLERGAAATRVLNRAISQSIDRARSGNVYPATFRVRRDTSGHTISVQWRDDQGTRGEALLRILPGELAAASEVGTDRALSWQLAAMTDAFRFFTLARPPLNAVTATETRLRDLYRHALAVQPDDLTSQNATRAMALSYKSLSWSTGTDPLDRFLTVIPPDFTAAPSQDQGQP